MNTLFTVDGVAFMLIGLIVLATPSPQPALVHPVADPVTLTTFKDTRRLLASQFLGAGALALCVGAWGTDPSLSRMAALARVVTILIVLAINAGQIRAGHWKRAPLYFITSTLAVIGAAYGVMLTQ